MNSNTKKILFGAVILVAVLLAVSSLTKPAPANHENFAMCLKDSGATFYGAFWCPHCAAQKALFGASAGLLPYVECSTPDTQGQTQICKDKNITGYPTWEFKDGSRLSGEISLQELAGKTGCDLSSD